MTHDYTVKLINDSKDQKSYSIICESIPHKYTLTQYKEECSWEMISHKGMKIIYEDEIVDVKLLNIYYNLIDQNMIIK
jgi:hypothetical protein